MVNNSNNWIQRNRTWLAITFFLVFFVLFFWELIFNGEQFCLRDQANFYYPLLEYIHNIWMSGNIPLWDPRENLGQPLAASGTPVAFYPGTLLFFLCNPGPFSYSFCFVWYHLLHILLAAGGLFVICRHWKISRAGSLLAALSYTFSGSVFFQYSNVIFLVGAAWLPWGICFGDCLLRSGSVRSLAGLALVLAMTVLGGEPQTAYLTGMILLGLWFLYRRSGHYVRNVSSQTPLRERFQSNPVVWLILAAVWAGLIAGIQVLPTAELSGQSDRVIRDVPVSIWDVPGFLWRQSAGDATAVPPENQDYIFYDLPDLSQKTLAGRVCDGLFCRTLEFGGQQRAIYHFSMGPWRIGELFWPNFCGKAPPHRSYWPGFFAEGACWTYSLYMGIIPLVLALSVFCCRLRPIRQVNPNMRSGRMRRANKKNRSLIVSPLRIIRCWATWIVVLSLLAALGGFGPHWFLRAFESLNRDGTNLHLTNYDPVGGIYWFFCVLLPKFSMFRFPAKMVVPLTLGLSILAGCGYDVSLKNKRLPKIMVAILSLSIIAVLFLLFQGRDLFVMKGSSSAGLFAGYQPESAWSDMFYGMLQTIVILTLFGLFGMGPQRRNQWFSILLRPFRKGIKTEGNMTARSKSIRVVLILLVLSVDLYIGNRNLLVTSSQSIYDRPVLYDSLIQQTEAKRDPGQSPPVRYGRFSWYPGTFVAKDSNVSPGERIYWERSTLYPKFHYTMDRATVFSSGTMTVQNYSVFLEWLGWIGSRKDISMIYAFLDCHYLIYPIIIQDENGNDHRVRFDSSRATCLSTGEGPDGHGNQGNPVSASLWQLKTPGGRVHILRNSDQLDDPSWSLLDQLNSGSVDHAKSGEYARLVRYGQNSLELDVQLNEPAEIVLMEQYFDGWRAKLLPDKGPAQSLEITKTLGFCRRLTLPAGRHHVIMEYCPTSFIRGCIFSITGGILCLIVLLLPRFRNLSFGKKR